jgi:hypothetical protein
MDTMKEILAGLKEMMDTAVKCRNEQPLTAYISAKLAMLEMAQEIRIPDMKKLQEKTAGNNSVSSDVCWAVGRIGYSLPGQTAFIVLPEENLTSGFLPERGCFVEEITKGLIFAAGFKKIGNSVLWMPEAGDCEFILSPGKPVASFKKTLMQRSKNGSDIQSLLEVWGEESIFPWPILKQDIVETARKGLANASCLLGDLHSILMAGGNGEWVFAETQDSSSEKRIYELKEITHCGLADGKLKHSVVAKELNKAIWDLGTCSICSSPNITGGGMLTLREQPGGYVYALCNKCNGMDYADQVVLLERKILNRERKSFLTEWNLIQGNCTYH